MALSTTLITPKDVIPDDSAYYGAALDARDFNIARLDIHCTAIGSGTFTVSIESSIDGSESPFNAIETSGSISAVGHTYMNINGYTTEADVLGYIRAKVNTAAGAATGVQVTIRLLLKP